MDIGVAASIGLAKVKKVVQVLRAMNQRTTQIIFATGCPYKIHVT